VLVLASSLRRYVLVFIKPVSDSEQLRVFCSPAARSQRGCGGRRPCPRAPVRRQGGPDQTRIQAPLRSHARHPSAQAIPAEALTQGLSECERSFPAGAVTRTAVARTVRTTHSPRAGARRRGPCPQPGGAGPALVARAATPDPAQEPRGLAWRARSVDRAPARLRVGDRAARPCSDRARTIPDLLLPGPRLPLSRRTGRSSGPTARGPPARTDTCASGSLRLIRARPSRVARSAEGEPGLAPLSVAAGAAPCGRAPAAESGPAVSSERCAPGAGQMLDARSG
jgi:hypothetical protein